MDIWPYFWIACMLGLVIAVSVVAIREKKARDAAISAEDGFGQADPLDGFGDPAEVGAFDDDAFGK